MPGSSWRSNHCICSVWELLALKRLYSQCLGEQAFGMFVRSTEGAHRKQSKFSRQNKSFRHSADSRRGVFDDPMELLRHARIRFRSTKHILLARKQFIKRVWHCTRNDFGARMPPAESTPKPNVLYLSSGMPQGAQTIVFVMSGDAVTLKV